MVLGIDIGTNNIGFSVMDNKENLLYKDYLDLKGQTDCKSLNYLYIKMNEICVKYSINNICLEHIFITNNFKAGGTIKCAEAVGVVMLFCSLNNIAFYKIGIGTVKKQITGNGRAKKEDIIKEINNIYKLKNKNEHIADAIAIALTFIKKNK